LANFKITILFVNGGGMRFGGHESFHIREGWLYKGVELVASSRENFSMPDVADNLGVGKNMAKSIRHWLTLTGLAESKQIEGMAARPLVLTPLGELVKKCDPYFLQSGTWWMLHANILSQRDDALVWQWLFNHFGIKSFERGVGFDHLTRFLGTRGISKLPSAETLHRDYSVILSSYSREIPLSDSDPEEALECPFLELELLAYHKSSGRYVFSSDAKKIHPAVFGYVVEQAFGASFGKNPIMTPLEEVVSKPASPGRVFMLSSEALIDLLANYEETGFSSFEVVGLAGMRQLRAERRSLLEWAKFYYTQPGVEG
jgi:hypothetical protein